MENECGLINAQPTLFYAIFFAFTRDEKLWKPAMTRRIECQKTSHLRAWSASVFISITRLKLLYILYGPLVAKAIHTNLYGGSEADNWCFHILLLSFLRCAICQVWQMYSNMYFLVKKYEIARGGVEFDQVDREFDWDNFILLQAYLATAAHHFLPFFSNLPLWNGQGFLYAVLLHMGAAEALFYWGHRAFHQEYLFRHYHCLHHASVTVQPSTAGTATFLEHILLTLIMAVPILGGSLMGGASIGMVYLYTMVFDFLRYMGHGNVEMVPQWIFHYVPPLKYLLYTPSYHSLHHTEMDTNFCLFMPLYDYLGHTLNPKSWDLHRSMRAGPAESVPDFVFLVHIVDTFSCVHARFIIRSLSAIPWSFRWYLVPIWPLTVSYMLALWAWAKPFVICGYILRGRVNQSWVIPRFGFQYFLPSAKKGINKLIEDAILSADKMGVKVVSLAALNKNEALNGGGTLFVKRNPDLKVRVVHGNTLTAAVIINEIPLDVKEVFLTGATSKLGRAIALYLCRKGIRVMMLTNSAERFDSIQREAPAEFQHHLVAVTKYEAGQNCKTWIVGKWLSSREQRWAPSGTHFHQFVVPPIPDLRRDCTYGKLAAMQLPDDVTGLSTCEYTMGRRVVHACHAGGCLHMLEGWTHHEVGAIDVERIDVVWQAALKHGMKPVQEINS